ncbi:dextranase-like [Haliotis rubra]|uniref:dextranase-like n=1 Tax=Haliotis rubra TaxID=36100 RepID=UPI001EE5FB2A|nr:dextranase-like [Haliotis rubra]
MMLLACLLTVCVAHSVVGNLQIYPQPHGLHASDKFEVYLSQGGHKQKSFTYITKSDPRTKENSSAKPHRSMSWTSFAFSGAAVTAEIHTPTDFHNCIVRPKSYNYHCRRTGSKTAEVVIKQNTKMMSVEFDYDYGSNHGDITDKFLIFADAPETHVPNKNDNSVLYFGPGMYNFHGQKELDHNIKEVYLAPGSYIDGGFRTSGGSVKIHGRGVISGSTYPHKDKRFQWALVLMDKGSHHTFEGITLTDPEQFFYRGQSDHNTVRNVKMVGAWTYNADGIAIGHDGVVEDSFINANDDALKLYSDNLNIQRVVIWQSQNGGVFQTGWWTGRDMQKVRVNDIDIIHTDWCAFKGDNCHIGGNDAVFDQAGDTTHFDVHDMVFSNVRIEGSCPRVIYFKMHTGAKGSVSNIRFENWSIESQPTHDNLHNEIAGTSAGGHIANWNFFNFKVGGQCITSSGAGDFIIDSQHASGIKFSCGENIIG